MARVKIPYYVVKKGRGYWQPTRSMREQGFGSVRCGPDGPNAWEKADQLNRIWQLHRHGLQPTERQIWPRGSIGEAFARLKASGEWSRMEPRTREDWERGQRLIEPVFADLRPAQVTFLHLDEYYAAALAAKGRSEAYRAIKHWRRLWKKMVAMGYAPASDPSLAITRKTPPSRSAVWREREAAHLVKTAIRAGYLGLACIIAVAWDTQFSPVDVRSLRASNMKMRRGRILFEALDRQKTGRAIIGTLSRPTERLLSTFMAATGWRADEDQPLFCNRSGSPYSKDTLGDDFRAVRALAFPGDKRVLMDMRRSGAVEAAAGEVDPNALAAKMGSTINRSQQLQRTYQPVDLAAVRLADDARRRGRKRIRDES